jgi:hypothetical protein
MVLSDKEQYKHEEHEFKFRQGGKLYCTHCGLFKLSNDFSTWAIRMGCLHKLHPSYNAKRYDTTKLPF